VPDPPDRSPLCGGQVIHNQTVYAGCVPQDDAALRDFQDFVNFLAGQALCPALVYGKDVRGNVDSLRNQIRPPAAA
jgi:hypothetical protein